MGKIEYEKLLQEVREQGVKLETINELTRLDIKHRNLVPIILKYLNNSVDDDVKDFLARCLCVKGLVEVSEPLIEEFYKASNPFLKWTIGNSLGVIRDKNSLPELIKIVQEKEHGISRQMIAYYLGGFKDGKKAKEVLIYLLNDEDVQGHAIHGLSLLKDASVIEYLEPFTSHKKTWIRNEAKKAIKRLEKIKESNK